MAARDYRDSVVSWALAVLRGDAKAGGDPRPSSRAIADLSARFALDPLERVLVELCYAAERSLEVARAARASSQKGGLTVEVARAALGDGVDAALAAGRAVRRHALIAVGDGSPWGAAQASSEISLAAGLAERLDGAARIEGLAPGVKVIGPLVDGTEWVERLPPSARAAELVKEEVVGAPAELFTVEGCSAREALGLAVALARRMARGVLTVDAEALGAHPFALLAAARRDADLDGLLLLVYQVARAGAAWRACAGAAAAAPLHPPIVVLTDGDRAPEAWIGEGLRHRALTLYVVASPAAAAPALAAATAAAPTTAKDDGYEAIRQMAARDADRALGISRPATPRPAPPPPVAAAPAPVAAPAAPAPVAVPVPVAAAGVPVAAAGVPVAAAGVPVAAAGVPVAAAGAPVAAAAVPVAAAGVPVAAAAVPVAAAGVPVAAAGVPVAAAADAAAKPADAPAEPAKPKKRSKKAMMHFGDPDAPAAPPAPAPAPPKPEPPIVLPQPPAAVAAPADEPAAAPVEGPPMALPEKATPDDLARISIQSPSAAQRVELIQALSQHKSAAVVAALRHNAKSEHAGVRAAAETAMAQMFGVNWNKTRAVPKPVQPPRSEDKGGGW